MSEVKMWHIKKIERILMKNFLKINTIISIKIMDKNLLNIRIIIKYQFEIYLLNLKRLKDSYNFWLMQ